MDDPALEDRQEAAPHWRGRGTQRQGDRASGEQQGRRDELKQHVLRHVDAEQRPLVGLDRRQQRQADGHQPAEPAPRAHPLMRVSRMSGIYPAHRPQVGPTGQRDRPDREEVEPPGPQHVRERRRGGRRAVRQHRKGQSQPEREAEERNHASHRAHCAPSNPGTDDAASASEAHETKPTRRLRRAFPAARRMLFRGRIPVREPSSVCWPDNGPPFFVAHCRRRNRTSRGRCGGSRRQQPGRRC